LRQVSKTHNGRRNLANKEGGRKEGEVNKKMKLRMIVKERKMNEWMNQERKEGMIW